MSTSPDDSGPSQAHRIGDPPRAPRAPGRRRGRSPVFLAVLIAVLVATAAGLAVAAGWSPFGDEAGAGQSGVVTTEAPGAGGDSVSGAARGSSTAGSPGASLSPSPSTRPSPVAARTVTVTGGGDVIGGFGVSGIVESMGSRLFKHIARHFEKSDFGFVNLESPLTTGGEAQGWKDVVIKGNPDLAPAMAGSGIGVVTLANNHAGDMGDSGLLDTFRYCRKNGIAVVGAGKDLKTARAGAVLRSAGGIKVAFLGFSDVLPAGYPATSTSPGISPGRSDIGAVKRAIRAAKKKADYVVVGWHWNLEYKRTPSSLEKSEGRAAIDAGADIVIAHHPHLLDGMESYHGGLIVYSLGNLVFSGFSGETAETVLVRAKLSDDGIDAQLVPVVGGGSGIPSIAGGSRGDSILRRVKRLSAALGTNVKIAGGRGYIHVRR